MTGPIRPRIPPFSAGGEAILAPRTFRQPQVTAADSVLPERRATPSPPGPGGWIDRDLTALDDPELLGIVGSLPHSSQLRVTACEVLVGRYRGLVRSCVQRYRTGPEPAEDLMQVGFVGLVKAINNFDPSFGRSLAAYAYPCITGEIKRHFRDRRWQVQVKRSVKDLAVEVRAATWLLTQELGRTPAGPDLARHLGVSGADLRDAQLANMAFQPLSLNAPLIGQPGVASLADLLGEDDPQLEHVLNMQAVASHWGELPVRERQILLLRFYGGMTQAQVGQQLGISQMHVSRLLAHATGYLRRRLLGSDDRANADRTARAAEPGHKHESVPSFRK
jgi:RNA polymerase sigma-B factor